MSDDFDDIENLEPDYDIIPLGDIEIDNNDVIIDISQDGCFDPLGDIDPLGDVCNICAPLGEIDLCNDENMGPITDYRQLLEVVKYNQNEQEQWYILLLFNP